MMTQASLAAQLVKNPPAVPETWVQTPGWKDPLEKEMASPGPYSFSKLSWNASLNIFTHRRKKKKYF